MKKIISDKQYKKKTMQKYRSSSFLVFEQDVVEHKS